MKLFIVLACVGCALAAENVAENRKVTAHETASSFGKLAGKDSVTVQIAVGSDVEITAGRIARLRIDAKQWNVKNGWICGNNYEVVNSKTLEWCKNYCMGKAACKAFSYPQAGTTSGCRIQKKGANCIPHAYTHTNTPKGYKLYFKNPNFGKVERVDGRGTSGRDWKCFAGDSNSAWTGDASKVGIGYLGGYIYSTREKARTACQSNGYADLCSKAQVDGWERCAAGWQYDYKGYWMSKTVSGCGGGKGMRGWGGGSVGAYCCGHNKRVLTCKGKNPAPEYLPTEITVEKVKAKNFCWNTGDAAGLYCEFPCGEDSNYGIMDITNKKIHYHMDALTLKVKSPIGSTMTWWSCSNKCTNGVAGCSGKRPNSAIPTGTCPGPDCHSGASKWRVVPLTGHTYKMTTTSMGFMVPCGEGKQVIADAQTGKEMYVVDTEKFTMTAKNGATMTWWGCTKNCNYNKNKKFPHGTVGCSGALTPAASDGSHYGYIAQSVLKRGYTSDNVNTLKYATKWPHCANLGACFSGKTQAQAAAMCLAAGPTCTGFSYTAGKTGTQTGGGCLKKCGATEFGGYGHGSHGYYARGTSLGAQFKCNSGLHKIVARQDRAYSGQWTTGHPYVYSSRAAALKSCTDNGFARLCSKAEVTGWERCAAGWMSDYKGYWMSKTVSGCGGGKGMRGWSGATVGAYCCGSGGGNFKEYYQVDTATQSVAALNGATMTSWSCSKCAQSGDWVKHKTGYECLEYDKTKGPKTTTFDGCKKHCKGNKFMDWKGSGSYTGAKYCVCADVCTAAKYPAYDIWVPAPTSGGSFGCSGVNPDTTIATDSYANRKIPAKPCGEGYTKSHEGYWSNAYTDPKFGSSKMKVGVGIAACGKLCDANNDCAGYSVYKPNGVKHCYQYSTFTGATHKHVSGDAACIKMTCGHGYTKKFSGYWESAYTDFKFGNSIKKNLNMAQCRARCHAKEGCAGFSVWNAAKAEPHCYIYSDVSPPIKQVAGAGSPACVKEAMCGNPQPGFTLKSTKNRHSHDSSKAVLVPYTATASACYATNRCAANLGYSGENNDFNVKTLDWLTPGNKKKDQWVQFDLKQATKVTSIKVWNQNEYSGASNRDAKGVWILYSTDNKTWKVAKKTALRDSKAVRASKKTPNPATEIWLPGGVPKARYFRIQLKTFYTKSAYSGLMRVKFYKGQKAGCFNEKKCGQAPDGKSLRPGVKESTACGKWCHDHVGQIHYAPNPAASNCYATNRCTANLDAEDVSNDFNVDTLDWLTKAGQKKGAHVTFDLQKAQQVTSIKIWNQNEYSGGSNRDAREIKIQHSQDNTVWHLSKTVNLANSNAKKPNPANDIVIDFPGKARYWRVTLNSFVQSSQTGGYSGLMRVKFYGKQHGTCFENAIPHYCRFKNKIQVAGKSGLAAGHKAGDCIKMKDPSSPCDPGKGWEVVKGRSKCYRTCGAGMRWAEQVKSCKATGTINYCRATKAVNGHAKDNCIEFHQASAKCKSWNGGKTWVVDAGINKCNKLCDYNADVAKSLATCKPNVINCVMNSWGKWGKCSKTCGPGTHSRSRTVKLAAKNGGAACGAKTESRNCQDKPCPLPCKGLGFIKADLKGKRTTVPAFANGCCILENANFYAPFDNVIKCKKSSDCCKAADIRGDPNYRMHQRAKPYAAKSYWDIDYECRHVAVAGGKICVPSIDPST